MASEADRFIINSHYSLKHPTGQLRSGFVEMRANDDHFYYSSGI